MQHPNDEFDKYDELCHEHNQPDGAVIEKVLCTRCRYPEPHFDVPDNPGGYYTRKRLAAEHWRNVLAEMADGNIPGHHVAYVKARLESAEYVGD